MSETITTRNIRTNRLTAARRAGLFLVGTAGALTVTGGFAGAASASTPPAPMPTLPIAVAPAPPQPPVGPMVIALPEGPGPVVDGPDDLVQPLPTPDPHPTPTPQGPDDFTIGEDDGPGFEGPDDFTIGETDPDVPEPQPEPEVEVLEETSSPANDAASSLAFTGSELGAVTAGLALLGVGGAAAAAGVIARRRQAEA